MLSDSRFRVAVNPKAFFPLFLFVFLFPVHSDAGQFLLDPRLSIAKGDFQLGGRIGGEAVLRHAIPLDFFLEMEWTPVLRTVVIQENPTSFYQYRERRFCVGPGISAGLPVGAAGFWTTGLGMGYTSGYYRGSNRSPPEGWTPWVETGFRWAFSSHWFLGASYRFQPLREASAHRVGFDMGFRLFSPRDADD